MQAAGHLVGVLVEFSARMQLGHDDLGRRHAFALVDVDRDAAAVVAHRAGAVGIERDQDFLGVARERFVDRVVDHLIDHVMQARAVIGVADIHAGTFADGIEAFQDLDQFRIVIGRIALSFATGGVRHKWPRIDLQKRVWNELWFDTKNASRIAKKIRLK